MSGRVADAGPLAGPAATAAGAVRARRRPGWGLVLAVPVVFLAVFFLLPLGNVALTSFTEPGLSNYTQLLETPLYGRTLARTFQVAFVITLACLLLGYPYAYAMHRARGGVAALLAALVLLPFWTSILVRSYSWTALLQDTGVVNSLLLDLGLAERPVALIRNLLGVVIGMSHILLPFMVLPLYASMQRIDSRLVQAAGTLGASPATAFRKVFLPLSMPGVVAGSLLVFVLSLGFYITPSLLGGPADTLIGELIVQKFSEQLDFGVGSALAVVLLVATLVVLLLGSRLTRLGALVGQEEER